MKKKKEINEKINIVIIGNNNAGSLIFKSRVHDKQKQTAAGDKAQW